MIELATLQQMFQNIRTDTLWDMDGPMLWGYFFTDTSPEKLKVAAIELEKLGYRYVDLFVPELDEGEDEFFFLHMEKAEAHSPESLNQRNMELYAFAEQHGLGSYDGMDVGPVDS